MENVPKVGVCVFIIKDREVLLGKRKGSHGAGQWAPPGGHLEFNEEIVNCAIREVREEASVELKNIKIRTFTNDIYKKENRHYITIYLTAEIKSGEVKLMEPDKCEGWEWFDWNNLPSPIMFPLENLLKQKFNPFE